MSLEGEILGYFVPIFMLTPVVENLNIGCWVTWIHSDAYAPIRDILDDHSSLG